MLTTRLGADTGRVLCLYEQTDRVVTLDSPRVDPGPPRWGPRHRTPSPGSELALPCACGQFRGC